MKKFSKDDIFLSSKDKPIVLSNYNYEQFIKICNEELTSHNNFYIQIKCEKCEKEQVKLFKKCRLDKAYQFFKLCTGCSRSFGINKSDKLTTQKHREETFMKRYHCKNPMQTKTVQEKSKKTCLKKYNCEYSFQSDNNKKKSKITMKEKFGVEHALQNKDLLEKAQNTIENKYGAKYYTQTNEWKQRINEHYQNVYGTDWGLQAKEIRNKIEQTSIEHFGTNNYIKTNEFRERSKKACMEKYGTEYPMTNPEIKHRAIENRISTMLEKYGTLTTNVKKYKYRNMIFDSSWEFMFYKWAKDNHKNIKRTNKKFEYKSEGKLHYYLPDFEYENNLIDIKGEQFIVRYKNGNIKTLKNPYNSNQIRMKDKYKCIKKNHIKLYTYKELQNIFDYFYSKYDEKYLKKFII